MSEQEPFSWAHQLWKTIYILAATLLLIGLGVMLNLLVLPLIAHAIQDPLYQSGIYFEEGLHLYQQQQWDQAAQKFRLALQSNPSHPNAHNNLGSILAQTGYLEEALHEFELELSLNLLNGDRRGESIINLAQTHHNLANVLLAKGDLFLAIEQLQMAVDLDPALIESHIALGEALYQEDQHHAAQEQLKIAMDLNPRDARIYYVMGMVERRMDPIKSVDSFSLAIQLKPDWAAAHNGLGVSLAQTGQMNAAIEQFKWALQLDPHLQEAEQNWYLAVEKSIQSFPSVAVG
ncbi:MAG: tetratricopeptide repeat protein [Cyanobacteriota bacterium]|nr:tetratricopeptide repeat protein [Cyanobacteriota bacterium]